MYSLGIDLGTQSVKVVVVDTSLKILGAASKAVTTNYPQPGWAEQNPELWVRPLAGLIASALSQAQIDPEQIAALGIAGQLDGCIACDEAGRALSPCLIWMDKRATIPELPQGFSEETGQVADPSHMGAKIRWLKKNGYESAVYFHQPVSYLVHRLTGAAVMARSLASTTMLFSLSEERYSERLLRLFEVNEATLPAVRTASESAGKLNETGQKLTGLSDCTVAVGTGDDFATPYGASVRRGSIVDVLGTAEVVGTQTEALVLDPQGLLESHKMIGPGYFMENPGWVSGGALTWIKNLLGVASFESLDELAATSQPGSAGVTFIPALAGAMAPEWISQARGTLTGMTTATTAADIVRAVMEGCCFALFDVVQRIRELGVAVEDIVLLGGGSLSLFLAQLRADITGLPVRLVASRDHCAIGAAMLGFEAIGESYERSSQDKAVVYPQRAPARAYQDAYQGYLSVFNTLKPHWDKS